jgi:type IV pilus assembly protein PilE
MRCNTEHNGFTLIELLITIAIIAILATVAYPSYQQFLLESRRADAQSSLLKLQLAQENLRGSCKHYALGGIGDNLCTADPATTTVEGSAVSKDGYYDLAITGDAATAGNSYILTATPVDGGPQTNDTDCLAITLTVNTDFPNGQKGGTSGLDCW